MSDCNEEVNLHECLELITRLARHAGKIIKSRINKKKTIETKANNSIDFVTETDQEVEKLLIEGIKQKYPHHKFIGEESFAAGIKEKLTCAPTWVIDPVDGTTNFVHSYPNVCISIGLVVGCDVKLGVIFNPILDMFFRAIKGEGAFLNDEPIKVSGVKQLTDALAAVEFGSVRTAEFRSIVNHNMNYLATNAHGVRSAGSAAWNLAQVARGAIDLYVEMGFHAWDMAAGDIIVREAGGTVIDPAGNDFELMNRRILATSSSEIAEEVYSKFQQYYPEHD
ncbi:inositol monophosphatase 1-like [Acyrthosiphon pisum]|uniref:Inositol-1-monophosphatase n=1 Tax=Acyrthosiphon pisum TaxID=7029 RepID=C4WVC9_ACYPI|nr:inositol monophosphatase 1-like [Acyrthosiphon pisum]BAH71849.1 ACYPI009018 [Acyrthosiphon pisum]